MKIGSSNDAAAVIEQYSTSKGLGTRISFHERYSTNKQGYGQWIVSNYSISEGMRVLEIGCGTGSMWLGHEELIGRCGELILSDQSEGMLATAKGNLGERSPIRYMQADIQELPFEDKSFDVVIANSMLYHVPDIERGIREVRRVLKDGGVFYCATYGEHNFSDTLAQWFALGGESFQPNHNFTLENGADKLAVAFADVQTLFYEDSLHVTDIDDLVEYTRSLVSLKAIADIPVERIRAILEEHAVDGALDLQKEYGMFVCR